MAVDEAVEFDAIVIGTGFGGAVTACRLVQAGFRICVLERGRRYGPADFPSYPTEDLFVPDGKPPLQFAPPPDFSRWLWKADRGIYDIRDLDDAISVQAAGYGGGSLIYANVHLRPPASVFARGWPAAYGPDAQGRRPLDPYFDLVASMLEVSPMPKRLAKTLQLKRAADTLEGADSPHWFRTPLAVNFDETRVGADGQRRGACDMRGRCWRGCDRQAKNTLDLNYLAAAERGEITPDVRTLAKVTRIKRDGATGRFHVTYKDLLLRQEDESEKQANQARKVTVVAEHVFLCAGAIGTTELLFKNADQLWAEHERADYEDRLGSHYFPNADSFSVVFDCDEPHEADYGPTITSAMLYRGDAQGDFSRSIDFESGHAERAPEPGVQVFGEASRATGTLMHAPLLDWGSWEKGTAVGALVVCPAGDGEFRQGETLVLGRGSATPAKVKTRSTLIQHQHWFLTEDGGYPPDLSGLVGIFRSPLWLRRNRYVESGRRERSVPDRRPATQRLRMQTLTDALGGTGRFVATADGKLVRSFGVEALASPSQALDGNSSAGSRAPLLTGILGEQVGGLLPKWFVKALDDDRQELFEQAAAFALPVIGRLMGELSRNVAAQIDPRLLKDFSRGTVDKEQLTVLVRGMLRQAVQILAGSEAAVAETATRLLLNPIPGTPGQLLDVLGDLLLWALAYEHNDHHTGILLTMGQDIYRGKLSMPRPAQGVKGRRSLSARLPSARLDTGAAAQEQVLRNIAGRAWHGELRTNPAWTTLDKRVTVHSQGGCPMGPEGKAVTSPDGEVYGCPNLFVMDAAAFPTSVGVNPSATIAAVAEYKIERFIQKHRRSQWTARGGQKERDWIAKQGLDALDPLNRRSAPPNQKLEPVQVLSLEFKEQMQGFLLAESEATDFDNLEEFPDLVERFLASERGAVGGGPTMRSVVTDLTATASDLARLVSADSSVEPFKISLSGTVTIGTPGIKEPASFDVIHKTSYLQMFVKPRRKRIRFFRYEMHLEDKQGRKRVLKGLKVLRNSPGFDVWHDTSTLYVEVLGGPEVLRGILRVSVDSFLHAQLPSLNVLGTDDAARRSWALVAFYKYFAGELGVVYMKQAKKATGMLRKLLTNIHV